MEKLIDFILTLPIESLQQWKQYATIKHAIQQQNSKIEFWAAYVYLAGIHYVNIDELLGIDPIDFVIPHVTHVFTRISEVDPHIDADTLLSTVIDALPAKADWDGLLKRLELLQEIHELQHGPTLVAGSLVTLMSAIYFKKEHPQSILLEDLEKSKHQFQAIQVEGVHLHNKLADASEIDAYLSTEKKAVTALNKITSLIKFAHALADEKMTEKALKNHAEFIEQALWVYNQIAKHLENPKEHPNLRVLYERELQYLIQAEIKNQPKINKTKEFPQLLHELTIPTMLSRLASDNSLLFIFIINYKAASDMLNPPKKESGLWNGVCSIAAQAQQTPRFFYNKLPVFHFHSKENSETKEPPRTLLPLVAKSTSLS